LEPTEPLTKPYDPQEEEAQASADIDKAFQAVRKVLGSTDAEFRSRSFILSALLEMGRGYQDWPHFARFRSRTNRSNFGTLQFPTEFTDFLMEAATFDIKTAVEIGVWRGASAYFAAAVLQRANRDCHYTMVDVQNILLGFARFSEVLNLTRLVPASSDVIAGQTFDYVFIDADHSYDGTQKDYANVGRFARKLCAFHDIHAREYNAFNGGIVRYWNELRDELAPTHRIVEFSHVPRRIEQDGGMGIGLLDMRSAARA
jgi:hypothetical protein